MSFKVEDYLDRRFYRLTVKGFDKSKYGSTVCACECECGSVLNVSPHDLNYGKVKSCGCLNDSLRAERNAESQKRRAAEFIGKRFGRLVVRDVVKKEGYRRSICVCDCDCGGVAEAYYSDLTGGKVKSCKCLRNTLQNLSDEQREEHLRERAQKNTRKWRDDHPEYVPPPADPEVKRAWKINNKEKYLAGIKRWEEANPDKVARYQLISRCRKFGITIDQYNEAFERQGGVCASCKGAHDDGTVKRLLAIDHDHRCCPGAFGCDKCFRGLLCDACNRTLAAVRDNPDVLLELAVYISEFRGRPT